MSMSRRPFGLALVCFAAATSLSAQPAAGSRPSVTMVVSVQAKKTVVVKDGEAQLHWVIAELPKPETIDMGGDEAFRRELASVLSGLAARKGAGEGKCLDLVAEIDADNEACSLWDALRKTFTLPRRIGLSAADPTTVGSWRTDAPQADNQLRYV